MIVLSNCLTPKADEGCLKVAVSLVRALKERAPQTTVIAYERKNGDCDEFITVNKAMLSQKLIRLLRKRKEPVLYIPFSAKMRSTAFRTFVVSLFARKQVLLLQSMFSPMGKLEALLMKLSGAKLVCLSQSSADHYRQHLGDRVIYLQAGVDLHQFSPVKPEEKRALREKYGLPPDKKIVLHVGHMKQGRNISQFLKLDSRFHGVLVASTHRPDQQEPELGEKLQKMPNFTLLTGYIPNIQEIYHLSDVYFFPVEHPKSCIDVPLSAMEAAACGIPVVATPFGELRSLLGKEGFYELKSFALADLNDLLYLAAGEGKSPRETIADYHWQTAAEKLLKMQNVE